MDPKDPPQPSPVERRLVERTGSSIPLKITLDCPSIDGRADNLSEAGVFFFSGDRLRVRVEYQVDGNPRSRSGYLVRVQRMSEESMGYAVEFDRP